MSAEITDDLFFAKDPGGISRSSDQALTGNPDFENGLIYEKKVKRRA